MVKEIRARDNKAKQDTPMVGAIHRRPNRAFAWSARVAHWFSVRLNWVKILAAGLFVGAFVNYVLIDYLVRLPRTLSLVIDSAFLLGAALLAILVYPSFRELRKH